MNWFLNAILELKTTIVMQPINFHQTYIFFNKAILITFSRDILFYLSNTVIIRF